MSQVTFENPTGSGTTSGFRTNGQLRITYTAGGGSITITAVEGKRKSGTETHQNNVPCTVNVGGQTTSWTVPNMKFNASSWTSFGFPSTTYSGLSGNTSVVFTFSSSSGVQGTFKFSGSIDAGTPTPYYWNDINAYNPGQTAQSGLIFDVSMSNGSSWANQTNEPWGSTTYAQGTTCTISNIRSNVTGAHYSGNNVTGTAASSFTWTFNTANWAAELYTAWDTYTVAYNANGGTGAPGSQTKTYGQNLTLSSTKPTRANSTGNGYTVTFNANGGSVSPTTKTATNTYSYSFNNWKATNGTTYNPGGTYSANEGTTMTAQWNTTTTRGAITTPTATRPNGTATRTVTFDAATNGGICSTPSLNSTATITYTANGWYTATSGGTKRCNNGGSYTPAANETVYQQWGSTTGSYSAITLPAATHANTTASRVVTIDPTKGSTTITTLTSTAVVTHPQTGWFTAATGGTNRGNAGATYTPSANETIYAQFGDVEGQYTSVRLPNASECTRPGHTLLGFALKKYAQQILYQPGEIIVPDATMRLYAIWDGEDVVMYYKSSGLWYAGKPYYKYNGDWYLVVGGWHKVDGKWYPFFVNKTKRPSSNILDGVLDFPFTK